MFDNLTDRLEGIIRRLRGYGKLNERNIGEALREIRIALLEADVSFKVAKQFIAAVESKALGREVMTGLNPAQQVVKIVHQELTELLGGQSSPLKSGGGEQTVMLVGLQGSGKTTLAGKLAHKFKSQGRRPLLAALDVRRPAAAEQLQAIGKQIKVPVVIRRKEKDDPVTVARDALKEAASGEADLVILDTGGRLHVDEEMMREAGRIRDVVGPDEIIFVADGMTGQDAVKAAEAFKQVIGFDGVVLTKMDSDARGGAALSIRAVTGVPIKFIGTGEKLGDLEPFHPDRIASRILGMGDVLSLVEKVEAAVDLQEAARLEERLRKDEFNFEDFKTQLKQLKKMGPVSDLLGAIPGMSKLKLKDVAVDDSALGKMEAIIDSMTTEERHRPSIINGSRRQRIARGSGSSIQDVNKLIKQLDALKKMVKGLERAGRSGKLPGSFPMPF
ncbi:signal recognition particle protein [candidate division KSB1 bacterium]